VVFPGTPQASELQLKPGSNQIGRGDLNDFRIGDPSVSSSHCQIEVRDGTAVIRDLGSTNGTFLNEAQIQESGLVTGQSIRLGGVEMLYYCEPDESRTATATQRPVARIRASVAPPPLPAAAPPSPPIPAPASTGTAALSRFCKFHPKSPARYLCNHCNRVFCELCVTTRNVQGVAVRTCRSCGVECVPLQVRADRPATGKSFFARLPGVFAYPFRGGGLFVLIVASIVIGLLQAVSIGWFMFLMKMMAVGYLFSYMQTLIHSTAAGDEEMPSLPGLDGLFGAFFQLAGTVLMCFWPPLGLLVARLCGVEIPSSAIVITSLLCSLYFPMGFLAAAMKDTAISANPLVVIPAIFKVPLQYLVTAILFALIYGASQTGDLLMEQMRSTTYRTTSTSVFVLAVVLRILWSFFSVYLLTINMRILGLLYLTNRQKLGWFPHSPGRAS
jgi:hypothetical protein